MVLWSCWGFLLLSARTALAIVGPTASGKTKLGIECARELSGEIIGTDSMQVYQGLSIGTAKPSLNELDGVVHHMLDVWPLSHASDVAEFQEVARKQITEVFDSGHVPIVVGGSVLYVNAVLDEFDFPGTDPEVRSRYQSRLDEVGPGKLHEMLATRDPAAAQSIHPTNGRRIVRALEVIELTGAPYVATLPSTPKEHIATCRVGLEIDRSILDRRIADRVDHMFAHGLVEEVEQALSNGLRESVTARKAIGYSQIIQVLDGNSSIEQARIDIIAATRKFARRQQRWFRQDPRITWLPWNAVDLVDRVLMHFDEVLSTHQVRE